MPSSRSHRSSRRAGPLARASLVLLAAGLAVGAACLPACKADGQKSGAEPSEDADGAAVAGTELADQIRADAEEAARLLAERDGQGPTAPAPSDWGTPVEPARSNVASPASDTASAANQPLGIESDDEAPPVEVAVDTQPGEPEPTTEEWIARLTEELAARLAAGAQGSEAFRAQLAASALSLASPAAGRPATVGAPLTADESAVLSAWRTIVDRAVSESGDGAGAEAVASAIRDAARDLALLEPFAISRSALCTRVSGFGQYEEFPSTTFLAGRRNDAVLYVEVDNFASEDAADQAGRVGRRVALSQTVSLYHDADDALAWRQPEQETVDISRNHRRDFFVVQRITLPETLTVGRYNLKVAMRDLATGQIAESIIPITIVADSRLVAAPAAR